MSAHGMSIAKKNESSLGIYSIEPWVILRTVSSLLQLEVFIKKEKEKRKRSSNPSCTVFLPYRRQVLPGCNGFWMLDRWTFTLLTIYFGCGSLLSIYGCWWYNKISSMGNSGDYHVVTDAEDGASIHLEYQEKDSNPEEESCLHLAAAKCTYVFEAMFQMNAGAVMLTDCVYWILIFPFLTIKDYNLNFMTVNMHTINAVLLLGDAMLNCFRLPFVRISLFILWTGAFVIFQWTIHAFVSVWWPYPFLDLSSPYAPLWYLLMALTHIPCYAIFALIVGLKHHLLSKWFPQSYQC